MESVFPVRSLPFTHKGSATVPRKKRLNIANGAGAFPSPISNTLGMFQKILLGKF